MSTKFTKENYESIQRRFESETGVTPKGEYPGEKSRVSARVAIALCVGLILACSFAVSADEVQAFIQKLFFQKPIESVTISYGYEEAEQKEIPVYIPDESEVSNENPTITITIPGHKGIDIVSDKGTAVKSVLAGTVLETGFRSDCGNYIVIGHEDGFQSKYAHLESILVETGQEVTAETQIGTVGSTGMSTGPHLHLEMTYNGEPIDPTPYIYGEEDTVY